MRKPTIEIPLGMRRPAEVERDELRKEILELAAIPSAEEYRGKL